MLLVALAAVSGCSSDSEPVSQPDASTGDGEADSIADDALLADEGAADAAKAVTPADYCEAVVDGFCAFYLRCGRMVAETAEQCREVFLETCNKRYEPVYLALVDAKLLSLSMQGVTGCLDHLANVECDEQIRDLDGACGQVWVGHQPVGKPCGLGIESFVCTPGSECKLDLSFCGVCTTVAGVGEPCGANTIEDVICGAMADCIDGTCKANSLPGQSCSAEQRCVIAAICVDGTCRPPTFGSTGSACDSVHRCQYRTACIGGSCQDTAMLGEACDVATACDSGRCVPSTGVCEERLAAGESCGGSADCLSGRCLGGKCDAVVGKCFQ